MKSRFSSLFQHVSSFPLLLKSPPLLLGNDLPSSKEKWNEIYPVVVSVTIYVDIITSRQETFVVTWGMSVWRLGWLVQEDGVARGRGMQVQKTNQGCGSALSTFTGLAGWVGEGGLRDRPVAEVCRGGVGASQAGKFRGNMAG